MRRAAALLGILLLLGLPARAEEEAPRVPLRTGSHADHGRLVFDWPRRVGYGVVQEDGRILLRFEAPAALDLAAARRPPRNVLGVEEAEGAIAIRVAPGARLRHFRLGNRVVVDLLDAPADEAAAAVPPALEAARGGRRAVPPGPDAALPLPPPPPPGAPAPATALPPPEAPAQRTAPPAMRDAPVSDAPQNAPPPRPPPPSPADAVRAAEAPPPAPAPRAAAEGRPVRQARMSQAISIPVPPETGLALLRRGEEVIAVLDRAVPLDLSALRQHPVFGALDILPAPEATVLRLPLAAPARIVARRDAGAWVLEPTREPASPDAPVLRAVPEAGPPARIALLGDVAEGAAGGVVAITDPLGGLPLLVATLRRPGPGVALARRLPELELLPTMMGAAVLARSDRVAMRPLADRIVLEAAGGGALVLGAAGGQEPPAEILTMTRTLDLPDAPVPALMERLRQQLVAVNETAPLSRGPRRRDAAETLLSLGLPQEAQAMAALALREDPLARDDPRLLLAQGAAALLGGRLGEAGPLADPRLPATDEVALWRALRAAAEGEEAAAPALVAGAPLLLAYPPALRERLLPMALETMATGGEAAHAARLLAAAGEVPGLDLARALLTEAAGDSEAALAAYDALVAGRDRRQRAVALRRAAELRLGRGALDAAAAAEALERALFAWRGGLQEVALRRRIAALRLEAGQGQAAFTLLEETARLFPPDAAPLQPDLAAAFAAALEQAPPLAAAALFDAHPDLLPEGERGEAAVLLLADRLAQLDLTGRAAALLDQAVRRAAPATRAAIGARLAELHMVEGEAAAAIVALDRTEVAEASPALSSRRALLRARALARRGDRDGAEEVLAGLGAAGAEPRAELRAEAQDWAGASAAQMEHLAAALPPAPAPLGRSERAALARAAAYAALAGDEVLLAALRDAHGPRMADGPLAEAFALLTGDPLRGIADLPRVAREIGMLRVLPRRLEALRGPVPVTR
ncbi:hypothetical protein [Roseomonas sp. HF4]|uniref:hypothetical protein n=1 Tax=Roseomonas sp. HF4 TaxID=2562313 RepID=UPI0010BFD8DB|nr:hypothetical protein [Roseomonas sp. HF4]